MMSHCLRCWSNLLLNTEQTELGGGHDLAVIVLCSSCFVLTHIVLTFDYDDYLRLWLVVQLVALHSKM